MKKIITITFAVIIATIIWDYLYFYAGVLYLPADGEISYCSKADQDVLYVNDNQAWKEFTVKGVNMGLSKPGSFATEEQITKDEYFGWLQQIQDMGANVVSLSNIAGKEFYDAFYEFNSQNKEPLYLIQGIAVDDYLINSIYSATDKEFCEPLLNNGKDMIDVIHGRHKIQNENGIWPVHYDKDVSPWVFAYTIGLEWEKNLVVYTEHSSGQLPQFDGTYLYTQDASNFEIFLATLGDELIGYETGKYGTQTLVSFANGTFTDPLEHEENVKLQFRKAAKIDVEHIKGKDAFLTGQFASYDVSPAYPDFYSYNAVHEKNTYKEYLTALTGHHEMPVMISGFGVPSSRGILSIEESLGRNQGHLNETGQGTYLVSLYEDIMNSGCNGGVINQWQDEWYKSSWNTMATVDLDYSAYWSDAQSAEQAYGLLTFDPGTDASVCYVDGDISDWNPDDVVLNNEDMNLSMKYDEKYIYFMVDNYDMEKNSLYIPLDITPESGAKEAKNLGISMSRDADFVIQINGRDNSRVWVQERYDTLSALFFQQISAHNFFSKVFPEKDSVEFVKIDLLLQEEEYYELKELGSPGSSFDRELTYEEYEIENPYHYKITGHCETGALTYGNGNPKHEDFDSLADFCSGENNVEIRIPWQMLNFADPVRMYIHDDYYDNYGIEYVSIDKIYAGAGTGSESIEMSSFDLKPLGKEPHYHERLKESYFIIQNYWRGTN